MTEQVLDKDEFEDQRIINLTQQKREAIVNAITVMNVNNQGIPKDQGQQILLMQSLDGLSSVALKRISQRQKAKADDANADMLKGIATELIRGMVGMNGKNKDNKARILKLDAARQEYVEGELSTDQTVIDESHIIAARNNLIPD